MLKRRDTAFIGLLLGLLITGTSVGAVADQHARESAVAIAAYLTAGRNVVARNQERINDNALGSDRFSPAFYENQVRELFLAMTGRDLRRLPSVEGSGVDARLLSLHRCAMHVIDSFQLRINRPGTGFKGVNPAMFGMWVGREYKARSGIAIKQTSLRYRARYNKPDAFEATALKKFEDSGDKTPLYNETTVDGKRYARYMTPLYITKPCLLCHGEPAGELDISGRAKEGYKEGDLRGAISIAIPLR